eukprot:jgi/Psemu1/290388/fgenesh1_pg.490_\
MPAETKRRRQDPSVNARKLLPRLFAGLLLLTVHHHQNRNTTWVYSFQPKTTIATYTTKPLLVRRLTNNVCLCSRQRATIRGQAWTHDTVLKLSASKIPPTNATATQSSSSSQSISKSSERWARMFGLLSNYKGREGHTKVPYRHVEGGEKLGTWIHYQRTLMRNRKMPGDRLEQLTGLGVSSTKARTKWDRMFDLLSRYNEREGDPNVPHSHTEDGENLGTWLAYQRKLKKMGKLSPDKLEKLEGLGGLAWGKHHPNAAQQKHWDRMLSLLCAYREREGDCCVPLNYVEHDAETGTRSELGTWLDRQRLAGARGTLHPQNQRKLRDVGVLVGPLAEEGGVHSRRWEDMHRRLLEYRQREGHCSVPQSYKDPDGKNLGTWLNTQRQSHKHGTLDRELAEKLEAIEGFTWRVPPGTHQWDTMCCLLKDYRDAEGDCNVPRDYVAIHGTQPKQLGRWLHRQRRSNKNGELSAHREQRLEDLGVVWDLNAHQWEEMFSHLKDYKKREGHCDVPNGYRISVEDDGDNYKNLGVWLQTQRRSKREGTLDARREKRLARLGVEWEVYSKWDEMFELLVVYQQREGDCLVPQNHNEAGKNLGIWMNNQRARKKAGSLTDQQCRDLEKIGVVWDVASAQWDSMVDLLVQYKERNGHCRVPQTHREDGKNLGTWLNSQRQAKRNGVLDRAKEQQLEEIGMVWSISTDQWDDMISLLVRYREREGDCMVSQIHREDDRALGTWLDLQRKLHKRGTLDPDKQAQLDAIGMVWDKLAHKWEQMFSQLLVYKEREGDCSVPRFHKEGDKGLGVWLNRQRKLYKTGNLDPSRQKRLEDAGVVLNRNEQKWEIMFALLVVFRNREGHCRVPQDHSEDDKKLGSWLDSQRQKKKKDKLDADLQARLETIGVEWNIYCPSEGDNDDDDWGFSGMDHLFDDDNIMAY